MLEIFLIPIISIISFIATFLSSMSGGGSSIIAIPVFLFMGIPFQTAVLMQQVSSAFWVLPASYNYLKGKKIDWFFLITFSILGLFGSYFGVIFLLSISRRFFELMVGTLIILLVAYVFFKKELGLSEKPVQSRLRSFLAYPFAILMGFYESFFGSGNGIIFCIISFYTRGFDFIRALGYYYAVAFSWVVFLAYLLSQKGFLNVTFTIPAVIGSILGGFLGSKYAKYKGNKFVKNIFSLIGLVLGLKLLIGI